MITEATCLLGEVTWLDELFSARNLGIALWVGLALLTISLGILMRTRWGQVKPISKCVALSCLAHILLLGYAYGTHLIFDVPLPESDEEVVSMSLVTEEELQDRAEDTEAWETWDRSTSESPTAQPNVAAPQRQDVAATPWETPDRSNTTSTDASPLAMPVQGNVGSRAQPPSPIADQPKMPTSRTQVAGQPAAPIQRPRSSRPNQLKTDTPTIGSLPRNPVSPSSNPLRNVSPNTRDPERKRDTGDSFQKLANMPLRSTQANAINATEDKTQRSSNTSPTAGNGPRPTAQGVGQTANSGSFVQVSRRAESGDVLTGPEIRDMVEQATLPRRLGDGGVMPTAYGLRALPDRKRIAIAGGGTEQTEEAVKRALKWLAENQAADGHWNAKAHGAGVERHVLGQDRKGAGAQANTGITGLAVLAFLAAGHTHLEGDYQKTVQHGLEYLLSKQADDGNLAGDARMVAAMYCHGMAALAISEAFALTGDHRLKPFVQRAVDYTVAAQNPRTGGWRYHPWRQQPNDQGDMSQFGWQVMTLRSASLAGIPIPAQTQQGMQRFIGLCARGEHGGLSSYRPGEGESRTMTAEALLCRAFLGQTTDGAVQEAKSFVLQEPPASGRANLYYWYYATLAMHQFQGESWQKWNAAIQSQLLARQKQSGSLAGSWDADSIWGSYGGRVYSTAMATLCLEVYYRYLPLYSGK